MTYLDKHEISLAILNSYFLGSPTESVTSAELEAIVNRELPDAGESLPIIDHMVNLLDVFNGVKVQVTDEGKVWHGVVAKQIEEFEGE